MNLTRYNRKHKVLVQKIPELQSTQATWNSSQLQVMWNSSQLPFSVAQIIWHSIIHRFQESFLDPFPDLIQKLEEMIPNQRGWLLLHHDSEYSYFQSGTRGEVVVSVGTYQCFLILKAKILGSSPTTSFSEIGNWV